MRQRFTVVQTSAQIVSKRLFHKYDNNMSYLDFQNEVIPDINRSRNITEQSMCPYFLCMSTSQLKLMRHVYWPWQILFWDRQWYKGFIGSIILWNIIPYFKHKYHCLQKNNSWNDLFIDVSASIHHNYF